MFEEITQELKLAVSELAELAGLAPGDILVVGCSTSEIAGHDIGTGSSAELGRAVFEGIYPILKEKNIYLAAQCCEHLNRAIIIPKVVADSKALEIVNVLPRLKAGGAFATACYEAFESPAAVEEIRADAGIDIGNTLIGMHLKRVAIPLRLSIAKIGKADLVCAKTRPKYIGGCRASYNDNII